jgi:hypothetical protein
MRIVQYWGWYLAGLAEFLSARLFFTGDVSHFQAIINKYRGLVNGNPLFKNPINNSYRIVHTYLFFDYLF